MGKRWFYRMLLSYLPVFMIIISLLLFFFFFAISEVFKKDAQEANQVYSTQVMKQIDLSLKSIDQNIVKEILSNTHLRDFFDPESGRNPYFNAREVSDDLNNLIINNPLLDSIYVYRNSDQTVLSKNRVASINDFGDRDFLLNTLKSDLPQTWSGKRMYREFLTQSEQVPVVSLVRRIILFSGENGLIISNVRISALQSMLFELLNSEINYSELIDADGKVILASQGDGSEDEQDIRTEPEKFKSDAVSLYTHWHLQSGFKADQAYRFISEFSYVWVTIGLLIIVIGIIWIIYITRRNYRPIETMMDQIQSLTRKISQKLIVQTEGNELRIIEKAIDSLIEEAQNYQQLHEDNMTHRKKLFFREVMEGHKVITHDEWMEEMERINRPQFNWGFQVALVELDKYAEFLQQYSPRDQYLLKYVIGSIVKEVGQNYAITVWFEWMDHHLLGVLYQYGNEKELELKPIQSMLDEIRGWVEKNLTFTVTIGVGAFVQDVSDICRSYEEAYDALKYKYMLGSNRTIDNKDIRIVPKGEVYEYLQQIRILAQQFRLGDPQWKSSYQALSQAIQQTLLSADDIENIISYFSYQINREMSELSRDYLDIWQEFGLKPMNEAAKQLDTFEEFHRIAYEFLSLTADKIYEMREGRSNRYLLADVKNYIEENYSDPDLSLNQLSDKFEISAKYLSHLFKEEFGENFVEFLAYVRVEQAKRLLKETTLPVQEIAKRVGYQHHVSFNRVFKKLTGATPIFYRNDNNG